jgi:hypothetical protein
MGHIFKKMALRKDFVCASLAMILVVIDMAKSSESTCQSHDYLCNLKRKFVGSSFVDEIWNRFSEYMSVICNKCSRSGMDCGCEKQLDNPPFQLLLEYTEFMIWTSNISSRDQAAESPVPCVLLDISQPTGIGNQLLSLINALIFSLITRRALAVRFPLTQRYDIDPVFDFDANSTLACRSCRTTGTLDFQSAKGLSSAMCDDFQRILIDQDCVQIKNPVQASLLAPSHSRSASRVGRRRTP